MTIRMDKVMYKYEFIDITYFVFHYLIFNNIV